MTDDVYKDPRVHPMSSANDGSYEVEMDSGGWAVFPKSGAWFAGRYADRNESKDLGPFTTRDQAIAAVLGG